MAISQAPLEERLSEILPEGAKTDGALPERVSSAEPDEPIPQYEPAHTADDNVVQVAGLRKLAIGGAKVYQEGVAARKAAQEAADVLPTPTPPGTTAAPPQAAQKQLENIELTITETPAAGTPPDTLMNLNRIDGPADFKQTVESLAKTSGIELERMTFEEMVGKAVKKGVDGNIIGELQALKKQYGDLPVDVVRLRLASYQNTREFYNLARRAYLNPDDVDLQAQLLYKLNLQNAVNDAYLSARTRAAQATAAGRIQLTEARAAGFLDQVGDVKIPAPNSAEIQQMLADPNVSQNLKVFVEKFVQLETEAAREGLINKVGKVGLIADLWDRTWKNGLLSGIGTHVVNLTSSTTFLASTVATRALAGAIGTAKRSVGMQGEVELGEAGALVAGMVHSFREGMSLAGTALRTGTTREMREGAGVLSDAGQKLEGQYHIFDARNYGIETEGLVKGINAYANFVTLLGGRPIMAMDELFKTMAYRAELYAQAYRTQRQVIRSAEDAGVPRDQAEMLGLQKMAEIISDPPAEIDELAKDFGHMVTFSRQLTGSAAKIQELAQDNLLGRITLPFVKTPVWVASEGMQHSAFAPMSKQWRQDFAAGGAKRELAMAKWGMGTMIMMGAGSLVADGRMTGGGPGDQNLRRVYLDSGWRPYSFVFQKEEWDGEFVEYLKTMGIDPSISKDGKLYVPFRGIDPVAGPMAMIADAVEYARYEDDQDLAGEVLLGAVWGLYGYVGQSPFLQGVSSIAGAFSATIPNPKQAFKNALNQVAGSATSYAVEGSPVGIFSSARATIERVYDPVRRMTAESPLVPTGLKGFYEALNRSISRTPVLSETLPAQRDYLGEIITDIDPANPWLAGMSGIRYSATKQRMADKIMIQLGMSIQKPGMDVTVGGVNVKLEVDEYDYLMKQLGRVSITTMSGGKPKALNIQDAIVEAAKTPGFYDDPKDVQQNNIRAVYSQFTEMARGELFAHPTFGPRIEARAEAAQRRRARVGNYIK